MWPIIAILSKTETGFTRGKQYHTSSLPRWGFSLFVFPVSAHSRGLLLASLRAWDNRGSSHDLAYILVQHEQYFAHTIRDSEHDYRLDRAGVLRYRQSLGGGVILGIRLSYDPYHTRESVRQMMDHIQRGFGVNQLAVYRHLEVKHSSEYQG